MAKKDNPFVAIAASLGGMILVMIVLFLIFAPNMVALTISISWAFVVLGIVMGLFALKASKPEKEVKKKR